MLKKVTKNISLVSFGTGISMFLGFIRDILVANFFGTSALLEAFVVSFRIPNLFRSILGEGFSDSVATPILSEHQDDRKRLFKAGSHMLLFSGITLLALTLLGMIFTRFFVTLLAPGFLKDPYKFSLTVSYSRITFLYLFFIGLSVNSFAILYSLKKFFIPAVTPALLNIVFIIGLLFFVKAFKSYILIICVVGGGVLQLLVPFLVLKKSGFIFEFKPKQIFKDNSLIRMLKLMPARVVSGIVYQLSVVIDTALASFSQIVGNGAVAALFFANPYIHLPMAMFIHSISRVAVVDLSFYQKENNFTDFRKLFVFSFQNVIFFIVPITMLYLFLSGPIIEVILYRGGFDRSSWQMTSMVLFFYSLGLFFFCGIKFLVNCFYALKDTKTPAKVTLASLLLNIFLSVCLMYPLKVGGIALGSSLAAVFNFFFLFYFFNRRIGKMDWQDTKSQLIKIILLSFIAAGISRLLWDSLSFNKYLKMAIALSSAGMIFLGGGYMSGIKQVAYLKKWIFAKR
ncbi:MAG: murein biosynthesis integral membrane protein MurJ [Candidatus Omnitrophica bacterium]|jgi:putative peptidoglycan lipid II flippase|nr:murein biosynthesis integral membrane protein MurJ [Candidatus Omnitrophota bacterium]